MTPRQRLIEMTANHLRTRETVTLLTVNEAAEEVAYHQLGGEHKRYYDGMTDTAWKRFESAVLKRMAELRRRYA